MEWIRPSERVRRTALVALVTSALLSTALWPLPESQAGAAEVPAELVGEWRLDEGEGDVAVDSSGHGNDGGVRGAVWADGHTGTALRFDGDDDHIDLDTSVGALLDGATGVTFSSWVTLDSAGAGSQRLFGSRINGGSAGFEVTYLEDAGEPRISVAGRSEPRDGYRRVDFDATGIEPGGWHHVVATLDFENDAARLHVDGAERLVVADNERAFGSDRYVYGEPSQPDAVGRSPDGGSPFAGKLDDVRVHRAALEQADVVLSLLQAEVERYAASGEIQTQARVPLERDLALAQLQRDHERDDQATQAIRRFRGWLDGPQGESFVDEDARVALIAYAEQYPGLESEAALPPPPPPSLERLEYNNEGLTVDLGVGLWAWPLPMDVNGDGVNDLLVSSPDRPYNGLWYFENTGTNDEPLFTEPTRLSNGLQDVQISHFAGEEPIVTSAGTAAGQTRNGRVYPDVTNTGFSGGFDLEFDGVLHEPDLPEGRIRGNQWYLIDFTGNGALDIVAGVGDWSEYGWDDGFDDEGDWLAGPLHGYVYLIENLGTTDAPDYADPMKIEADGEPIDVYGAPSPVVADFTGDGTLDIITGEFLDTPLFFENVGGRTSPEYAAGRPIPLEGGGELAVDLQMMVVTAVDWTDDGRIDLVIGEEDGRVSLIENTGQIRDGMPVFEEPVYFQQEATDVKVGALSTPSAADWDGDGLEDLIVGDTAGRISFIKNLGGDAETPSWAAPRHLQADGAEIRHQAGPNGSIQGPAEAKWGYTAPVVADWNQDGLLDILVNDIWGKILWYENVGTRGEPQLAPAQPVEVAWDGPAPKPAWTWWQPGERDLVTQWRTTPFVIDLNEDGLNDLVMLDHEGYLAFFERDEVDGEAVLLPGERIFTGEDGSSRYDQRGVPQAGERGPIQMNMLEAGQSGRRKFTMVDWTDNGRLDIIANDGTNVGLLENVGSDDDPWVYRYAGSVSDGQLVGHTTTPTIVDRNDDSDPDLLIGAEDGHLYYQPWNHGEKAPARWSQPAGDLDDLVGDWAFDESTGHVALDGSGYANHGVVHGATRIDGHTGNGLRFDAFNDFVDLSHTVGPMLDGASGITYSSWVRLESMESGAQRLFATRINGGTAGFEVTFENVNGRARIAVAGRSRSPGDAYRKLQFDASTIQVGEWHHVAAQFDFERDAVRLFVDGVERADSSDNGNRFSSDHYQLGTPTEPDSIGRSPNGANYVRGSIDGVRVHRAAVSQHTILLDAFSADLERFKAEGGVHNGLYVRLERHLRQAILHLDAGGEDAARVEVAAAHDLLADGNNARFVREDADARLTAFAREYLLRIDPGPSPDSCAEEPAPDATPGGTWRSAVAAPRAANALAQAGFGDQTLRMIARTTEGGCELRVRLSNEFGDQDVTVDRVTVALHDGDGWLVPGTQQEVEFSGSGSVLMAQGAEVVSDAVPLPTADRAELAVSLYVSEPTGQVTTHNRARERGYISGSGDRTEDIDASAFGTTTQSWMFLSGIDVAGRGDPSSVVAVGDSLTDGLGSSIGAEKTWPDQLGDRLLLEVPDMNVASLNRGVSAGRLLRDAPPSEPNPQSLPSGLARLDRDLAGDEVSAVILFLGINDIIQGRNLPEQSVSATELIEGYREYIARAHDRGIRVVGATLTPYGSSRNWTAAGEAIRQDVNTWIRTSGEFDSIVDFDAAVRDPDDPLRIDPRFDHRDGLHFNDAGYRAMAEAVDLGSLR